MNTNNKERFILSLIVITFTIVWFFCLMFLEIPKGNKDLVVTASGMFLTGGWVLVLAWWFSSSKGSADKQEKIDAMTKPPAV
jgi:hypothetical protein